MGIIFGLSINCCKCGPWEQLLWKWPDMFRIGFLQEQGHGAQGIAQHTGDRAEGNPSSPGNPLSTKIFPLGQKGREWMGYYCLETGSSVILKPTL